MKDRTTIIMELTESEAESLHDAVALCITKLNDGSFSEDVDGTKADLIAVKNVLYGLGIKDLP